MKLFLSALVVALASAPAQAQLRGHGGPVRAVAVSADGATALSGSFDTSAIRWSLDAQRRRAGAALPRRRGECGRAAEGRPRRDRRRGRRASRSGRAGEQQPDTVLEGHTAPIVALARVARRRDARLGRRGITRCGSGRSPAARRACSKATRRTSTASRSRRTASRVVSAGYDLDAAHLAARRRARRPS